MTRNNLSIIWRYVEVAYNSECINSERALQSMMYHAFMTVMPAYYIIFVEPTLAGYCPDLVVANRLTMEIECILELKFAPHWWHSEYHVRHDLNKIQVYNGLRGNSIQLDVFGPRRVFHVKRRMWTGGKPQYTISLDALFCFADIARKESVVVSRKRISHPIAKHANFVLLSGATDPNTRTAVFSVQ